MLDVFSFFVVYFYVIFLYVLSACMSCGVQKRVSDPLELDVSIRNFKLQRKGWELNLDLQEEPSVVLTAGPSL